jgi:hypothetical protein
MYNYVTISCTSLIIYWHFYTADVMVNFDISSMEEAAAQVLAK